MDLKVMRITPPMITNLLHNRVSNKQIILFSILCDFSYNPPFLVRDITFRISHRNSSKHPFIKLEGKPCDI